MKTFAWWRSTCIAALLLLTVSVVQPSTALGASTKTFYFTGTMTFVSGTPFGLSASIGQQVQGSFTYDTSLAPAYNTGYVAGYIQQPPSGMSLEISGVAIQSQNYNSFQVVNDAYGGDNFNGYFTPILVNGTSRSAGMGFTLLDTSYTALVSTALPTALNVTSFNSRTGFVYEGSSRVDFSIDTLSETPPPIPVTIDIKPGSFPNSINPQSPGLIPVAILTTSTFDATAVDVATVRFGATATEATPVLSSQKDVDGDGDIDVIVHFKTQDTGIQCGHTSAFLAGMIFNGKAIAGSDSINTVPCR